MGRFKPLIPAINTVAKRAKSRRFPLKQSELDAALVQHRKRKSAGFVRHSQFSRLKREMIAGLFPPSKRYLGRMVERLFLRRDIWESDERSDRPLQDLIRKNLNRMVEEKTVRNQVEARQRMLRDIREMIQRIQALTSKIPPPQDKKRIREEIAKNPKLKRTALKIVGAGTADALDFSAAMLEIVELELFHMK